MQLVLPVSHTHTHRLDNFIAADNALLVKHLRDGLHPKTKARGSAKALTFVYGSSGSGKSHLLLACHYLANELELDCQYIDIEQLIGLPCEVIDGLGNKQVLCIDNVHLIAKDRDWQIKMFDTINQFLEVQGQCMLISSNTTLTSCGFSLPDLNSRLQWGTTFQVKELSDTHKLDAVANHFKERGISVEKSALSYLLSRANRDMHELTKLVTILDEKSLQSHRKMTIPFIKQTLFTNNTSNEQPSL